MICCYFLGFNLAKVFLANKQLKLDRRFSFYPTNLASHPRLESTCRSEKKLKDSFSMGSVVPFIRKTEAYLISLSKITIFPFKSISFRLTRELPKFFLVKLMLWLVNLPPLTSPLRNNDNNKGLIRPY